MARLAGMVHGVVVQITTDGVAARNDSSSSGCPSLAPVTGNLTHTVGLTCGWYSISASARAVRSTGDHITGLDPRYSWPEFLNLLNSATIAASVAKSMVA